MATSSKRTYAIATPTAPVPVAEHCPPEPPQETLKHSSVSVSVGSLAPVRTRFLWALWASLAERGLILNASLPLLLSHWGFCFALGHGVSPHSRSSTAQLPLHKLHLWLLDCKVVSNSLRPHDCSLPGSSVHEISQARVLEWVAISFSRGFFPPRDRTWVSSIAGRCFTVWATNNLPQKKQKFTG